MPIRKSIKAVAPIVAKPKVNGKVGKLSKEIEARLETLLKEHSADDIILTTNKFDNRECVVISVPSAMFKRLRNNRPG